MSLPISSFRLFRFALLVGGLSFSIEAFAFPEFPSAIRDSNEIGPDGSGMTCTPTCSICHTTDPGQRGNAGQSFAQALVRATDRAFPGAGEPEDVEKALQMLANDTDSDEDGVFDKTELGQDPPTDPSNKNSFRDPASGIIMGESACAAVVEYGCGAHVASRPEPRPGQYSWLAWGAVLGLLLLVRRKGRDLREATARSQSRD